MKFNSTVLRPLCTTLLLCLCTLPFSASKATSTSPTNETSLQDNKCLQQLKDTDLVVVSAAFHDGTGGFSQLKELTSREPWGNAVSIDMKESLEKLLRDHSPFLILQMTKKQAIVLDDHRDLIKWVLVQSLEKTCS